MSLTARPGPRAFPLFGVPGWVYWPTFVELYDTWSTHPEYSHGLLVPLFALYLLAKRPPAPTTMAPRPWPVLGFAALGVAVLMRLAGSATSFLPLEGVSFVLSLAALAALAGGRAGLARFWPPIVFLVFMVPLPYEMSRMMGAELQRIATICTTFLLQCFGQPAVAEGNRILIEGVTLNVVEACSGLRMLVTIFAFSVAAVFVLERLWLLTSLVLAGEASGPGRGRSDRARHERAADHRDRARPRLAARRGPQDEGARLHPRLQRLDDGAGQADVPAPRTVAVAIPADRAGDGRLPAGRGEPAGTGGRTGGAAPVRQCDSDAARSLAAWRREQR